MLICAAGVVVAIAVVGKFSMQIGSLTICSLMIKHNAKLQNESSYHEMLSFTLSLSLSPFPLFVLYRQIFAYIVAYNLCTMVTQNSTQSDEVRVIFQQFSVKTQNNMNE